MTDCRFFADVAGFRHELHRIPELAGAEVRTAALLRERVSRIPAAELKAPLLGTDVVADLRGEGSGTRCVALRADIDALVITEASGCPYASERPGFMHACGHDGHSAMLLGALELLAGRRSEWGGTIRFIWQPGEENRALGRDLVAAGVLENPRCDMAASLHGLPGLPVGKFGFIDGVSEASCAHFKLIVRGRGGHSSRPQLVIDPVLAAAALIVELQQVVARRINPLRSAVLSVCRVAGGTIGNVIPDEVELEGTARALDAESAAIVETAVREVASGVAAAHGCRCEVEYRSSYPVCINAPEAAALARRVTAETFGPEAVVERAEPSMGADDFAYYAQQCPAVYVKLGLGDISGLHTSRFDFPDAALEYGIRFLTAFALAALKA